MEKYIEALRKGKGYDWICLNGHTLSKDELLNIIKEFDYAAHSSTLYPNIVYESVADELEGMYVY